MYLCAPKVVLNEGAERADPYVLFGRNTLVVQAKESGATTPGAIEVVGLLELRRINAKPWRTGCGVRLPLPARCALILNYGGVST
jgi:hypothetical protein